MLGMGGVLGGLEETRMQLAKNSMKASGLLQRKKYGWRA